MAGKKAASRTPPAQRAEREVDVERFVDVALQHAAVLQEIGDGAVAIGRAALVGEHFLVDRNGLAVQALGPGAEPGDAPFHRAVQLTAERDSAGVDQRVGWLRAMGFESRYRTEAVTGRFRAHDVEHLDRAALFQEADQRQQLGRALKRKFVVQRIARVQRVAAREGHRGAGALERYQCQLGDVRGGLSLAVSARLFQREIQDRLNDGVLRAAA